MHVIGGHCRLQGSRHLLKGMSHADEGAPVYYNFLGLFFFFFAKYIVKWLAPPEACQINSCIVYLSLFLLASRTQQSSEAGSSLGSLISSGSALLGQGKRGCAAHALLLKRKMALAVPLIITSKMKIRSKKEYKRDKYIDFFIRLLILKMCASWL